MWLRVQARAHITQTRPHACVLGDPPIYSVLAIEYFEVVSPHESSPKLFNLQAIVSGFVCGKAGWIRLVKDFKKVKTGSRKLLKVLASINVWGA